MARIGIVTCETILPLSQSHESPLFTHDDVLFIDILRQRGHEVVPVVWRHHQLQVGEFDLILQRSPWDYSHDQAAYLRWLQSVVAASIPLHNSYEITRWNSDKHYLRDLAQQGMSTIPTLFVAAHETLSLLDIMQQQQWEDMVVKPAISAAARDTFRVSSRNVQEVQQQVDRLRPGRTFMVQPFIREILTEGEWSFTFIAGQFSHALRKRAKEGDYRVQDDHGGKVFADIPHETLIAQATAIVSSVHEDLLYARVDGIDVNRTLFVVELELVEPELFLRVSPEAPSRFADAIESLVYRAV